MLNHAACRTHLTLYCSDPDGSADVCIAAICSFNLNSVPNAIAAWADELQC